MLNRRVFWISATVALGALAVAACEQHPQTVSYPDPNVSPIGGPFQLVDADDQPVTQDALKGKWTAIYFGFTNCPDVCPTTLQALKEGLDKLGPRGAQVQSILISVDPDHDTPAVMKAYIANPDFPKGLRGFTGTPQQIATAAAAYKVYYEKQADGMIQHQSIIYLMNPQGQLDRPLTHDLTPTEIAAQIGDAMRQAG